MTLEQKLFWQKWRPTALTCLCFIRRGEEVLFIRKKRGIGAGKINGPGGHLNPGETALEAAVREVQEELKVTPLNLKKMGELSFQFIDAITGIPQQFEDGQNQPLKSTDEAKECVAPVLAPSSIQYTLSCCAPSTPAPLSSSANLKIGSQVSGALHTVVFLAESHEGTPEETAEAIPHWIPQTQIPFHEMWEDDQYWLPGMLEGKTFQGFFHFDGDKMLSKHVEWGD